jgi:hypothetical protein
MRNEVRSSQTEMFVDRQLDTTDINRYTIDMELLTKICESLDWLIQEQIMQITELPSQVAEYEKDWRDCPDGPEANGEEETEGVADGCQPEDDYCGYDQDCEKTSVDCIDDVEEFGGGDSKETATGDPEYDPEGNNICGNEETGEERT